MELDIGYSGRKRSPLRRAEAREGGSGPPDSNFHGRSFPVGIQPRRTTLRPARRASPTSYEPIPKNQSPLNKSTFPPSYQNQTLRPARRASPTSLTTNPQSPLNQSTFPLSYFHTIILSPLNPSTIYPNPNEPFVVTFLCASSSFRATR